MKQRFLHVLHGSDQTIIDNAIDEWHGRLRECMRAKDGVADTSSIVTIFSHMTRDVSVFVKYDTIFRLFFLWKLLQFHTFNFRKVVRQQTEGVVEVSHMGFVGNLPGFPTVQEF